ncbi:uncharacterized protein FIESC28_08769 [Fusarium coffeatum]|uniref:Uncharacterized protein n=1 Tax=Fusarium coffeatum TaxID=231269 RepID=A0A366R7J6_9HYPO|nr:uncharacterized protein FIESC28_08769 [Fusarium coffeatum]RBR12135.1 hypothetical protein FIESC28_08769 [Fusarium coffeatum]
MSSWWDLFCSAEKKDQPEERPTTSRWLGPSRAIQFDNGHWVHIPDQVLQEHPQFLEIWNSRQTLQISGIPHHVAHIIVHFLFTKQYQNLKFHRPSEAERNAKDFATAVYVHGVSLRYRLIGLRQLAAERIELYGDKMALIDIVKKLPKPPFERMAITGALYNYVCHRMNVEGVTMSLEGMDELQNAIGGTMSGILCQKIASLEAENKRLQEARDASRLGGLFTIGWW